MNRNHPIYTERLDAAEVAAHFGVADPTQSNPAEVDVYPGGTGLVLRAIDGSLAMHSVGCSETVDAHGGRLLGSVHS